MTILSGSGAISEELLDGNLLHGLLLDRVAELLDTASGENDLLHQAINVVVEGSIS
jgi:peptide subunit release factor 1 (eRF1)